MSFNDWLNTEEIVRPKKLTSLIVNKKSFQQKIKELYKSFYSVKKSKRDLIKQQITLLYKQYGYLYASDHRDMETYHRTET